MGDALSEWLRIEVQLGNRDRVIPWSALTARDAFFAGCYPVLAGMVESVAESIPTSRTKAKVTLGHLLHHLKRSYGKLFDTLNSHCRGANYAELVTEVRVIGLPRRVDPSCAAAGVLWADVLAQAKRSSQS